MLEFKEKKKAKKMMYSKPVLFILGVVFLLSIEGLWNISRKHSEAFEKAQEAKIDLQNLQAKEAELEKKVASLKTESGRDEEIRKKFMVGKEGEGVILIVDPVPSTTTTASPAPDSSRWASFLNFFR